jgi:hypothetical protein
VVSTVIGLVRDIEVSRVMLIGRDIRVTRTIRVVSYIRIVRGSVELGRVIRIARHS